MLRIEHNDVSPLFSVYFEDSLEVSDFENFSKQIDAYIAKFDRAPRIVIHTAGIPHWKDFEALKEHLEFIQSHHEAIDKVAIVGDNPMLAAAPWLANFFVKAKLRHFSQSDSHKAVEWALVDTEDDGNLSFMTGLPSDTIGVMAKGVINGEAYEKVLLPAMEKALKEHEKINCLLVAGKDFKASPSAIWDDAKFGLMNYDKFKKLALVTDNAWMSNSMKLFAPMMPAEVKVFLDSQLEEAKKWISS